MIYMLSKTHFTMLMLYAGYYVHGKV